MITSAPPPVSVPMHGLRDNEKHFRFSLVEGYKATGFHGKEVQESLFKWGMQDHAYMIKFNFDHHVQPYEIDSFILDFFNDPDVNPHIRVLGTKDRWGKLGTVTRVEKEDTTHTVTNLGFFDKLKPGGPVVRRNGEIIKCLDEYHDSFLVADELRNCLLVEASDNYGLFSQQDRKEFIFHVFKLFALGGKLCQYEDTLEPYLSATRVAYKDMISVAKDPQTNKLRVASMVFKITNVESAVSPLFPIEHPQNFCYLSIDPLKRTVHVFYHASDSYY
ncbi:hypothetical protein DFJ77DRAFT_446546 [Powellomyces hirtus]|nr:hypothetical protein DFJ77DRAFT_446546 [Powellomyces hirtus]